MKAIKVSFLNIVKAQNAIDDNASLSNKLFQTSSNYWIIDVNNDAELNSVLTEIERVSDECGFDYKIEVIFISQYIKSHKCFTWIHLYFIWLNIF